MKLTLEQYKAFLEELAKCKKVELNDIKTKMANCGPPGISNMAVVGWITILTLIFIKKSTYEIYLSYQTSF